jgi:DNA-binding transcriptional ArsR family regulator
MLLLAPRELSAMQIVRALPLSQPACSLHLRALKQAGIVRTRDHGPEVFYSLNKGFVRAISLALHKSVTTSS